MPVGLLTTASSGHCKQGTGNILTMKRRDEHARNRTGLRALVNAGFEPGSGMDVDVFFVAPDESSSAALAEALAARAWSVEQETEKKGLWRRREVWHVYGCRHLETVTLEVLDRLVDELGALAEAHGTQFDGWEAANPDFDDWVIVTYVAADRTGGDLRRALRGVVDEIEQAFSQEMAVADSWQTLHKYEISFMGTDGDAMWQDLQPILERAPVTWNRVEIRHGFEDPQPRVVRH